MVHSGWSGLVTWRRSSCFPEGLRPRLPAPADGPRGRGGRDARHTTSEEFSLSLKDFLHTSPAVMTRVRSGFDAFPAMGAIQDDVIVRDRGRVEEYEERPEDNDAEGLPKQTQEPSRQPSAQQHREQDPEAEGFLPA